MALSRICEVFYVNEVVENKLIVSRCFCSLKTSRYKYLTFHYQECESRIQDLTLLQFHFFQVISQFFAAEPKPDEDHHEDYDEDSIISDSE